MKSSSRIWAIDFLGQGMSLPTEDPTSSSKEEDLVWRFGDNTEPWATDLVYSKDFSLFRKGGTNGLPL